MAPIRIEKRREGRREFLAQLSALAACGLNSGAAAEETASTTPTGQPLPTIALGTHRLSRLIAGWNPVGGHSYLGPHMDRHMREYFTVDRTVEFLLACENAGITAHQYSPSDKTEPVLRQVRERGSKMKFLGLHAGRDGVPDMIRSTSPIAMVHHGGVTDRLFSQGKSCEVHDYVKTAHDHGVLAGVSAHNPDCIQRIADEGWEVDFFMTCFYFLTRKFFAADGELVTPETLQIGYPFYRDDPSVMTRVVRQVEQPCLVFKILAAGRLCGSQDQVRSAFRYAFENIKPTDGAIVGMYPRFFDEINADAAYTRQCAASGTEHAPEG
jgi:hypothetical protein